jgi:hypothetical protein
MENSFPQCLTGKSSGIDTHAPEGTLLLQNQNLLSGIGGCHCSGKSGGTGTNDYEVIV